MRVHPLRLLTAASLVWLSTTTVAQAGPCMDAAISEYLDCQAGCQEDFQVAKDSCLNRDHLCVEACRADREDCRTASGIDADLAVCADGLTAAVANCRAIFPPGDSRDSCIDDAQVAAFQCRDQAREDNADELDACRATFRTCAGKCGPSVVPVDRGQCRRDAKRNFRECRATCREDFQVAKDACRNRDHACVEQCRDARAACSAPVLAQLESDIAACNATRDAAIAQCHVIHPDPGTALDGCIDQAQVVAFECRDQAREDSKPGLEPCRAGFAACVGVCPPA
jgi:hypothetical protein